MSTRRHVAAGLVALACLSPLAWAGEAKLVFTGVPASTATGYVTVELNPYANDLIPLPFTTNLLKVNNIPFAVPDKGGANHLFMKDLGWANWEKDPGAYYSPHDRTPATYDPHRAIVRIPVSDYYGVHLLASAVDDPAYTNVVGLRIGAVGYSGRVTYHDHMVHIPRSSDKTSRLPFIQTDQGRIFLVYLPIDDVFAQDFEGRMEIDVDITKEIRLAVRRPDPARFQYRPLGPPSGVRLFGMTFRFAPVHMTVTSSQPGQVFNEPEVPTFHVDLRKTSPHGYADCRVEATATDYYGNQTNIVIPIDLSRRGHATASADVSVPVGLRGYHELEIRVMTRTTALARRQTTFALLPPDTRKHRDTSPFGTWDFCGGHYTPNDPELVGPLYVKAGLRYGMFSFTEEDRARYGVLKGNDSKVSVSSVTNLAAKLAESGAEPPARLMIFHETAISGPHITRPPDLFVDKPPYALDEKEQERFDTLWSEAETTAKAIRKHFPETEIYFGNGTPHLLEAFAQRSFPAELLGSRGNEAGTFHRMPETQPLDYISNNGGLWMDRMILDHYGYTNTPLRQCYEMCYAGTSPGNLSLRTQANYYVRHMMHSLAWRIPVIRAFLITDVGNSYYFSNWGSAGFCFSMPHVRPKPSYVACATLTLMLDGAEFTRPVPTGSPVVYALEFKRPDGRSVTCLWTLRGERDITVEAAGIGNSVLTDLMANPSPVDNDGKTGRITVSESPVFLVTQKPTESLVVGEARMQRQPEGKTFLISHLGALDEWTVENDRRPELEIYNFTQPRRKGVFEYTEVASFAGQTDVLGVTPHLPVEGSEYLQMYSVLAHKQGVEIPGKPTEIGLMVNGNGGWGHVYFEFSDASGQRWVSLGAEQKGKPTRWLQDWLGKEAYDQLETANLADWNTDDPWQRSSINFEGWRYLEFPLPGNYPGEGYHWPCSSQWRYSGDGVVKYPLTFKKLVVTMPERIVHLTDYRPVPRKEIYLKDLMVTYDPIDIAFEAE